MLHLAKMSVATGTYTPLEQQTEQHFTFRGQPIPISALTIAADTPILGEGSFGQVSLASISHPQIGDLPLQCAIKAPLKTWAFAEGDPEERQNIYNDMRHEFNMGKQLGGHSNIVEHYALYQLNDDPPQLVLELCDAGDLRNRLNNTTPMPVTEILSLSHDIAAGLAHMHSNKIAHADLKPDNIFLHTGKAKVADLGSLINLRASKEGIHEALFSNKPTYTPVYRAPESLDEIGHLKVTTEKNQIDPVYARASKRIAAYQAALTEHTPKEFQAKFTADKQTDKSLSRKKNIKLAYLNDVYAYGATLEEMLEKVPEDNHKDPAYLAMVDFKSRLVGPPWQRPANMSEVKQQLQTLQSDLQRAHSPTPKQPTTPQEQQHRHRVYEQGTHHLSQAAAIFKEKTTQIENTDNLEDLYLIYGYLKKNEALLRSETNPVTNETYFHDIIGLCKRDAMEILEDECEGGSLTQDDIDQTREIVYTTRKSDFQFRDTPQQKRVEEIASEFKQARQSRATTPRSSSPSGDSTASGQTTPIQRTSSQDDQVTPSSPRPRTSSH